MVANDKRSDAEANHSFLSVLFLYVFPIGETSAGKSSLINLLLNDQVMPTGVLQNTLTICEISYGRSKEAVIHFDKPEEAPIRIKEKVFDRMQEYIQQPDHGERRCKRIEIKIPNALLKVETLFLGNYRKFKGGDVTDWLKHRLFVILDV